MTLPLHLYRGITVSAYCNACIWGFNVYFAFIYPPTFSKVRTVRVYNDCDCIYTYIECILSCKDVPLRYISEIIYNILTETELQLYYIL